MKTKYKHTNIVDADWRRLARFYQKVFACEPVPPERDLQGEGLEKRTSGQGAHIIGAHLRLPGYDEKGPTLEIYQYSQNEPRSQVAANREGIMYIAFEVDDVEQTLAEVLRHGGTRFGEIACAEVKASAL
jgi:predicted enzyme related to lactoylglutathione lyase